MTKLVPLPVLLLAADLEIPRWISAPLSLLTILALMLGLALFAPRWKRLWKLGTQMRGPETSRSAPHQRLNKRLKGGASKEPAQGAPGHEKSKSKSKSKPRQRGRLGKQHRG